MALEETLWGGLASDSWRPPSDRNNVVGRRRDRDSLVVRV